MSNDLSLTSWHPGCNTCDPPTARMLDQSAARFNDQSGFNVLAAQQNFIMQQQAQWMKLMEQQNTQSNVNAQMLLRSMGAFNAPGS